MRFFWALIVVLLVCGCVQGPDAGLETTTTTSFPEPTTTTGDEFAYAVPSTTTATLASSAMIPDIGPYLTTSTTLDPLIMTFQDTHRPICRIDGKPVIRMYGRSDCEHCNWSGPIFDKLARDYVDAGSIVAYHWIFDKDDDTLTECNESGIPESEVDVFRDGKSTTVPYFSFGCRFTRIGNGYYVRNRPDMEEDEFHAIIKQLIN
ncbi:MAG: hypothetical protein V1875_01940 [Candidatus Altiarchaeota archaeon]